MRRDKFFRLAALASVAALVTTGCLQSSDEGGSTSDGGSDSGTSTGAGGTTPGDKVVEIVGAFTGAEQDAFEETLAPFEDESGIDVQYAGNADFTTLIRTRVNSEPPDIALFPQPGLLLDLASQDNLVPIDEFLDVDSLNQSLIPGFLDSVTDDSDTIYGAPMRMAVKSLVWVPKQAWADAGYTTEPGSIQELEQIAEEIKASGTDPWCMGYEAGAGTGWVGTDWIEEFVLRVGGPDVYDQWVSHEIPFNDDQIKQAFEEYQTLLGTDADNVLGGREGILNTSFLDADNPQFEDPPGCLLQRQGNFVTGFYPDNVQKDLDSSVDVFTFPPLEGGYEGQPILGGGDIAGLFNGEDDDAKQVMEFLSSDQFGAEWAQVGGWLSPHTTFDASNYPDDTTRKIAELASSADIFRYDASDLMPAEVGAGTFWTGMVDWIQGAKTTDEVTQDIEDSWPAG